MHQNEINNVSKLTPFERYKYFIKKVADTETIFTIVSQDEKFGISELEDRKLFPLWSSHEFAEKCLLTGWRDFKIIQISLIEMEDEIYQLIKDEDYLLNIFPIDEITGFIVSLDEFSRDLENELEKYR